MIKFPDLPGYSSDYVKAVLDEIALEGLDGISPNDLWTRLLKRPHFCPQPSDEAVKIFLWDVVRRLRSVEFFELPDPRPPLVIYDRFEHVDPDLGMLIEPAEVPLDIYPNCKVEDLKKGIIGSCSTYDTRKDVTDLIRPLEYKDVEERWGYKLVVVASQTTRKKALLNQDVNPNLELTPLQYLIMERVGRSRYHGEITQGRDGLQLICEDAKSLFYLRKILHKHRLITKQVFHHKVGAQNSNGLLLHLPRFFVERKPKPLEIMEKIAMYLKTKPNHMEEHNILRHALNLGTTLKKIIQAHNFQKFVKSDNVLHRVMYPEAAEVDWRYKGAQKERLVRVLYLVNPNMDIKDLWQKYETMYEDDDDDKYGILTNESHRLLDRTLLDQAYAALEKVGPDGMSQVALASALGMDKLLSRSILRNLTRLNKVTVFMKDEKKQRTTRYTLKKFEKTSTMRKQVFDEQDKLMKLVDKKSSKNVKHFNLDTKEQDDKVSELDKNTLSDDSVQGRIKPPLQGKNKIEALETTEGSQKKTNVTHVRKRKLDETDNLGSQVTPQPKKKKVEIKVENTKKKELASPAMNAECNVETTVSSELKVVKPDMKLISKSLISSNLLSNTDPGLETSSVSFRLLKRTNMILEAVRKQKVVFDTSKLQKMIYEEEIKEGYEAKMDKKSLLRIIHKLALDKLVQHLEITLRANHRVKVLRFVCDPSVSHDHSVIQSAIDQAKMKLEILGKESMKRNERLKNKKLLLASKGSTPSESLLDAAHQNNEENDFSLKYNSRVGRMYGFKPKYMRMQVLHKYMFYLIYGYEGDEQLNQNHALAEITKQSTLSDELKAEMSQIYTPSIDWQMFLPPLPVHVGYPEGWALMSDILLRIPLSIFVQVVNVSYEVPGFEEYLNHPIKKHFLVKNLPPALKTACTYARKYIFAIHEQVVRLCFTGLLQLGPQRLKEKDQVFVYLNRHAVLWDTISSPCGYFQIASDKEYPVHRYHFLTAENVEHYWHDLWNFCVHTILGGRLSQSGQTVVVEGVQTKPIMLEAVEPRGVEEAPLRDVGYIPGDHLGAAGVDSAMFAHLKRNWYWNPLKTNFGTIFRSPPTAPTTELPPVVKLREIQGEEKKPLRVISETSSARRRGRRVVRQERKEGQRIIKRKLKVRRTVRTLKDRVLSRRKPYYDQTDREALQRMSKLRVDWTAKEDNLLLLCKVAMIIFQFIGRRYQNFSTVRQILHEQCLESIDKTSRACQRRLNYMMKNSHTQRSVNLCVEEMKQDQVVMKKLQDFVGMMVGDGKSKMSLDQKETQLAGKYKQLVLLLKVRYKELHRQNLTCVIKGFVLPDSVQQLLKDFKIVRPKNVKKTDFNEIHNIQDIYSGVIHSTIMSSLNCVGDKTSWAYQLFNIYQQYPDKLLRAMMTKTRADRMVSLRKHYMRKQMGMGDYLPLSSSPYQLSIRYINMLLTRYQFELYSACRKTFEGFSSNGTYKEVVASEGGEAACAIELVSTGQIDFKLDIPNQMIVMDPNVIKKDETYSRIVKRYQDILAKCKDTEQVPTTAIFDQSFNVSQDWAGEEVPEPSNNTVAKAASRIALYFTRDEYDKGESSCVVQNEMQHAHDFFVLNATRVFSRFINTKTNKDKGMQKISPLPTATANGLIKRIKRLAVLPIKVPSDTEVATAISSKLCVHQQLVLDILNLIKAKKELGVTTDKLREEFGAEPEVYRVLCALVEQQVCLYTGVIKTRFVHVEFHRPWVIRSHHIVRLEKEKITDSSKRMDGMMMQFGKAYPDGEVTATPKQEEPTIADVTPSASSVPNVPSSGCSAERPPTSSVRLLNRKFKRVAILEAKGKKDLSVCMRPWIRVNGSLNRRALDKFLSSVLGHVMLMPLCSLRNVQERFSPAFQPHHTREIVEMLVELKCVQMIAVKQSGKPGLFSKPSKVSTYAATGLEREEDLLLEPDTLAITRLALFIGDSAYQRDIFPRDDS